MAKKSKEARIQVILECTEQKNSGVPGMSRYITTKNKKNTPGRLELRKYNPYLRKVTIHKEIKINKQYGQKSCSNLTNIRKGLGKSDPNGEIAQDRLLYFY
jgi:large subunit ribosomal protein L33